MCKIEWMLCPVCGSKTRDRIREDTILINYPLYCPKCKMDEMKMVIKEHQQYLYFQPITVKSL